MSTKKSKPLKPTRVGDKAIRDVDSLEYKLERGFRSLYDPGSGYDAWLADVFIEYLERIVRLEERVRELEGELNVNRGIPW